MSKNRRGTGSLDYRLLIVEDDPADWELFSEAVKHENLPLQLSYLQQGKEVVPQLTQWHQEDKACFPDLMLLDLNLPDQDGREILRQLRSKPELATLPVVIFSASKSSDDVVSCYRAGCNCFIVKPNTWKGFYGVVSTIFSYWFDFAELPDHLLEV